MKSFFRHCVVEDTFHTMKGVTVFRIIRVILMWESLSIVQAVLYLILTARWH
jgi:hypothetical protein